MADPVVNCVPPHPNAHLTDAEIMARLAALTPPPTPDAVALVDAFELECRAHQTGQPHRWEQTRAALLAAMRPTPEGWKLRWVPVEPTEAMLDAAHNTGCTSGDGTPEE